MIIFYAYLAGVAIIFLCFWFKSRVDDERDRLFFKNRPGTKKIVDQWLLIMSSRTLDSAFITNSKRETLLREAGLFTSFLSPDDEKELAKTEVLEIRKVIERELTPEAAAAAAIFWPAVGVATVLVTLASFTNKAIGKIAKNYVANCEADKVREALESAEKLRKKESPRGAWTTGPK